MSVLGQLYRNTNDFDLPKWSKRALIVSIVLVVVSIVSIAVQGVELSTDFEGGSRWEVPAADFSQDRAREVLDAEDAADGVRFQEVTTADGTRVLRITSGLDDIDRSAAVGRALAEAAGLETGDVTVTTIGPSWGEDITRQAAQSLIWFMILVAAYLAWRLEWRMAVGALAAVLHDIIVTVGVYSILRIEVTPATVIAFLTILGYSLYDTVVVFDRFKDGLARYGRSGQYTVAMIMRRALNHTLMRCINTSVTTILPVLAMLVVGGWMFGEQTLVDFSFALVIGLLLGIYSSIFVAAPVTMMLKEREPREREIRARLAARGVDVNDSSWPTGRGGSSTSEGSAGGQREPVAAGAQPGGAKPLTVTVGGHPPRPRKKRKR